MVAGTVLAALAAASTLATPTAASAAPYCGITWGSLDKAATAVPSPDTGSLTDVRAGQHDCYDRLVIDSSGAAGGFEVEYVSGVPFQARAGTIPLRGGAFLNVVLRTPAYDPSSGTVTYSPDNQSELVDVAGWRTLRQVAWGGSFEGQTTIGVGVRARLPFRAFTLPGPGAGSRLVIDIAHRW
jgi:hypothetical protein